MTSPQLKFKISANRKTRAAELPMRVTFPMLKEQSVVSISTSNTSASTLTEDCAVGKDSPLFVINPRGKSCKRCTSSRISTSELFSTDNPYMEALENIKKPKVSFGVSLENKDSSRTSMSFQSPDSVEELRKATSLVQLLQNGDWEAAQARLLTTRGQEEARWDITDGKDQAFMTWSPLAFLFPPSPMDYKSDPPCELVKALIQANPDSAAVPNGTNLLIAALNVGASRQVIQAIVEAQPKCIMTRSPRGDLPIHFAIKRMTKLPQPSRQAVTEGIQVIMEAEPQCLRELDGEGNTVLSLAMKLQDSLVALIVQYDPDAARRPNPDNVWPIQEACEHYSWSAALSLLGVDPAIRDHHRNIRGQLPFHVAFECRSAAHKFSFVKHLLQYSPGYVTQVDPTENLAPFMLAAVGGTTKKKRKTTKSDPPLLKNKDKELPAKEADADQTKEAAEEDERESSTACLSSTFALLRNCPDMLLYRG